ncbi:hypothetical protein FS842_005811, partial [Serendipita sp. 407]
MICRYSHDIIGVFAVVVLGPQLSPHAHLHRSIPLLMSVTDLNENRRKLYLDHIEIHGIKKWKFRIKLRIKDGNDDESIELIEHAHRWTPSGTCEVPATGSISVTLKAGVA